jgi:hypothetical protein
MDQVDQLTSAVPYGVSGAIILGATLDDWIVIGTALLLACNLGLMALRIYKGLNNGFNADNKEDPQ